MNCKTICILLFFVLVSATASAQKNKVRSIRWNIAGILPSVDGKPLGLAGAVIGVNNDKLIVAGGSNFPGGMPWQGGKKKYYDDLYVFKKDKNDSLLLLKTLKLPFALAYSANVSTKAGIIAAGGENENGISNKVLLIEWDEAAENVNIKNLPDLPYAFTNAAAGVLNNRIYLAGGEMVNAVSSHFLALDPGAQIWQTLASLSKPTSHAVMLVQSNDKGSSIYIIGGRKKNADRPSDLYSSVFQYDPMKDHWTEKRPLPYSLSAGTGVSMGSGSILLFGGDKGSTFHKTEELIFATSKETDKARKDELVAEKNKIQSTHPGFSKQVLLYDTNKDKWENLGCIPYESPVTTTAIKWGSEIIIPGGEIRAGVRTPQILLAKIAF
jgi:N-acetylneuraminate epimerase